MSKDMKKRGMGFVGPIITYSFLQSIGIVNDHLADCEYRWGIRTPGEKSYDFCNIICKSHRTFGITTAKVIGVLGVMYREILHDLEKWKDKSRRKPLIITWVRQCGKAYYIVGGMPGTVKTYIETGDYDEVTEVQPTRHISKSTCPMSDCCGRNRRYL